jgi:hypothetical protein
MRLRDSEWIAIGLALFCGLAWLISVGTDALYDDRRAIPQLAWWVANSLTIPIVVFCCVVLAVRWWRTSRFKVRK